MNPKEKDKGFIQTPKKKAPRIAHIENRLNIVQLDTGNIDALQNGLCLWKGNISVFHSHAVSLPTGAVCSTPKKLPLRGSWQGVSPD